MEGRKLTIYLAGPISNCNENQKTVWRNQIKKDLRGYGHKWLDPTDRELNWNMEPINIEQSDVVVANLWRESVGTVVGIVRARRMGKPVILIDPNHIGSKILAEVQQVRTRYTIWPKRSTN